MSSKLTQITLGCLIKEGDAHLQTGPFGTALKAAEYSKSGVPLISVGEIKSGYLDITNKTPRIDAKTSERLPKFILKEGDIVFGRKGAVDRNSIINSEQDGWFLGSDGIRLRLSKNYNSFYISYLLRSPHIRSWLLMNSEGTTMPSLNQEILSRLPLIIPTYSVQNKIAKILCRFDGKIKINNQINQTLEQMAQALFKSWFVDFEPVKAKVAVLEAGGSQDDATLAAMTAISGKDADALAAFMREHPEQYAELKATAELFPSAMQDSGLGDIPEGWLVSDLSEVALLNAESWSKKNTPESVSYVDLANTKWGVINSIETYQFSDSPSRARRILKPHDTIVGTVRPGNRSYSYINKTGLTGSTGFAVLTPKARIFSEYIYLCVTSNESIERLAHLADGGAYPVVNADVVLSTQCVLPIEREIREALLKIFSSKTDIFFSYRANSLSQNEMLSSIRDTLLPKLLSGEITLPEAELAVSEAENV